MSQKKRARIHPVVAITAILALAALAIAAEYFNPGSGESIKIIVAAGIAGIAGVKLRQKLPVT